MLVPHQDGKKQRTDTFLQVFPQHGHPAFQPSLHEKKVLSPPPPDLVILQSSHDRIADGRHGDVDVGNVPPDIAHRYLPHTRRPQHLAKGPLDAEQSLPDLVRTRP